MSAANQTSPQIAEKGSVGGAGSSLEAGQPTNGELELGVCAVKCGAISLDQLKELRSRRTTWYGTEANELRYSVDRFIRERSRILSSSVSK